MEQKIIALTALASNFDKKIPKELFDMWLNLLDQYTGDQVSMAVKKVICEYEYKTLPPFAVIKKALDEIIGQKTSPESEAIKAWDKLVSLIASVGSYGSPTLDGKTQKIVSMFGGWGAVCQWETSSLDFKRKAFIEFWINMDADFVPAIEGGRQESIEIDYGPRQAGVKINDLLKRLENGRD